MILKIGAVKSGFKILSYEFIEEVHSHVYMMEHEQSGARLMYFGNDDDNKVFTIAFRTPVENNTGVPHILEHSVLCGSRKYPLKEPFVELVKGSLNTFLNAMTYPDKTVYPVASRNSKDFRNLMDVYLDAVFYPRIYENKYTLLQEGWHYNIENPAEELTYNGVVYNEMKGVYSSPEAEIERQSMQKLFPDTSYRFDSGGYPDEIPSLSQKDFEAFHKKFYVPENSYIYIYGDMDIEDTLEYLDKEYLSAFTKTGTVDSSVKIQNILERTAEKEAYYAVDQDASMEGKTYHELSIVTGKNTDTKTMLALRILQSALLESEGAPLKKALLQAGIAQNIYSSLETSLLQPVFSITASGSEPEYKDKFVNIVYKTLQELTVNGLDKNILEAAINAIEFKIREADFGSYPKGLIWGLGVMDVWIYENNPLDCLHFNKHLAELRRNISTRYYEHLIENFLMDNTHKALVSLIPEQGKESVDTARFKAKMAAVKAGMGEEELASHIRECCELHRLQSLPDSPDALASIPLLRRGDIKREAEVIDTEEIAFKDSTVLFVEAPTNKIAYIRYYFDVTDMNSKLLPLANLLVDVLGKLDTASYKYEELATETYMYTGGISFDFKAIPENNDTDKYKIFFILKTKVMQENLAKLFKILRSIAHETMFADATRLKELVAELKTSWDNEFFNKGQSVAIARLNSYTSASARVNEQEQYSYYKFLTELLANFDNKGASVLQELQNLMSFFFNKANCLLAYSCSREDSTTVRSECLAFIDTLTSVSCSQIPDIVPLTVVNEAIATSGKVQYVAAGGNFAKHGYKYTGAMKVLETVLKYEYLWNNIRIQGGAYGATAAFTPDGMMVLASYRDPHLTKTLESYNDLAEWLANKKFDARELDKYVIGTISTLDIPLTNSMRLDKAIIRKLNRKPHEYYQQIRNEILDVKENDLNSLAEIIERTLEDDFRCVVGSKSAIDKHPELFNKVINI